MTKAKASTPSRGPTNPSDPTTKQGFSVRQSLLEKAKARALETHGGNLSLYLSSLIERDTGGAGGLTLESLAGEVREVREDIETLAASVKRIQRKA